MLLKIGFNRFENGILGPKKVELLPARLRPAKSVKMVVSFVDLWPLSSFHPFPPLKEGGAKKPSFIVFFLPPLFII